MGSGREPERSTGVDTQGEQTKPNEMALNKYIFVANTKRSCYIKLPGNESLGKLLLCCCRFFHPSRRQQRCLRFFSNSGSFTELCTIVAHNKRTIFRVQQLFPFNKNISQCRNTLASDWSLGSTVYNGKISCTARPKIQFTNWTFISQSETSP